MFLFDISVQKQNAGSRLKQGQMFRPERIPFSISTFPPLPTFKWHKNGQNAKFEGQNLRQPVRKGQRPITIYQGPNGTGIKNDKSVIGDICSSLSSGI